MSMEQYILESKSMTERMAKALGFTPMTDSDREAFAGAGDNCLILYPENDPTLVIIYDCDLGEIEVIDVETTDFVKLVIEM